MGYQQDYIRKLQYQAYEILGNKCVECGETKRTRLTIDHIAPCGKNRKTTVSIYLEIVNNPAKAKLTYQLLCRNCNWDKMIENNERLQLKENPFAYRNDVIELTEKVSKLENKIERLINKQHKKIQKRDVDSTYREKYLGWVKFCANTPIFVKDTLGRLKRVNVKLIADQDKVTTQNLYGAMQKYPAKEEMQPQIQEVK